MGSIIDDYKDTVELRVPCKAEYVRTVRTLVADIADTIPLPVSAIEEVKVAASEAVANIVRHAYADPEHVGPIFVTCSRTGKKLVVEIVDWGVGFNIPPARTPGEPDISREGGYGIILIRSLMDSVEYWSEPNVGTRIRMVKTAPSAVMAGVRV
jgi:serine/threonine-protein kinase RsbW